MPRIAMRRRRTLLAAAVVGLALPAAVALGSPVFGPVEPISPDQLPIDPGTSGRAQLGLDDSGRGVFLTTETTPSQGQRTVIQTRCGAPEIWDSRVRFTPTGSDTAQDLAVAPNGAAVATWIINSGSNPDVYASYRPAGGTWGAATPMATGPAFPAPDVAIDPAGDAVIVWHDDDPSDHLVARYHPANGGWDAAKPLPDLTSGVVAIADDGSAAVVGSAGGDIRVVRRPAGGAWGTSSDLVAHLSGSLTGLRAEYAGTRLTTVYGDGPHDLLAASSGGGAPAPLDSDTSAQIALRDLARTPQGLVAAWTHRDDQLEVARLTGGWEAPKVYQRPFRFGAAAVASDAQGDVLVAAQLEPVQGEGSSIWSATADAGQPWGDLTRLSPDAHAAGPVFGRPVAAGSAAGFIVAWGRTDTQNHTEAVASFPVRNCDGSVMPTPTPTPTATAAPTETPGTNPPIPQPTSPAKPRAGRYLKLPACLKHGRLTLKLKHRGEVAKLVVKAGRHTVSRSGGALKQRIKLRGLSRRVKVKVTVTLKDGRKARVTKTLKRCR
jgi:hypothetical protein